MKSQLQPIPQHVQLEAACSLNIEKMRKLFQPFGVRWAADTSSTRFRDCKHLFTFSASDLLEYLRRHPEKCGELLQQSYNKRWVPDTFLEEWEDKYRVGWYEEERREVEVFEKIEEAAADYILFSLGLPRLRSQLNG